MDSDPGSHWHGPRLLDKVCIVTGSSRGVGAAIARGYASEGARVVVTYSTNSVAAAEIAREVVPDVVIGRIRLFFQQLPGHEDETGRTIAALEGTALDERLLFR